jgi:mannose-6-phosphate isomerase-like protein (cupin superfamily)
MAEPMIHDPSEVYLHLGIGPEVGTEPVTPEFWPTIHERTDLQDGRLITGVSTVGNWPTWEMHPNGDEVIVVTEGSCKFTLDDDRDEAGNGTITEHVVTAPEYIVVPAGHWHTLDEIVPGRALVITWGEGTRIRPR